VLVIPCDSDSAVAAVVAVLPTSQQPVQAVLEGSLEGEVEAEEQVLQPEQQGPAGQAVAALSSS
jgi:hypothetical protein